MIRYAIIGAGWRSEFYLRIAAFLPDTFKVSGIYIRNKEKQHLVSAKYKVRVWDTLEGLLNGNFDFVVSCVNKAGINDMIKTLTEKGVPILSETPVTDGTLTGKVQVAEQFHYMPHNQAYKRIIDSGILGEVHQVQLSCCHGYHAASLIRFFLNTGFEIPETTSVSLIDKVTRYNGRNGLLPFSSVVEAKEEIKILKFKDKSAICDFSSEQYFSDIRTSRTVIRGECGEIINNRCTYLNHGIPHSYSITRNAFGHDESLDGMSLCSITGEGMVLYTNPFPGARLSDEELAIATCLYKMKEYLETGKEFYSVQAAAFDTRLM